MNSAPRFRPDLRTTKLCNAPARPRSSPLSVHSQRVHDAAEADSAVPVIARCHEQQAVVNFVLGKFSADEQPVIMQGIDQSIEIIKALAQGDDMPTLMNKFN